MSHQIDLELIDCKAFKNGTLLVSYRVKHPAESKTNSTAKAGKARRDVTKRKQKR
jgi:hypothetical protein